MSTTQGVAVAAKRIQYTIFLSFRVTVTGAHQLHTIHQVTTGAAGPGWLGHNQGAAGRSTLTAVLFGRDHQVVNLQHLITTVEKGDTSNEVRAHKRAQRHPDHAMVDCIMAHESLSHKAAPHKAKQLNCLTTACGLTECDHVMFDCIIAHESLSHKAAPHKIKQLNCT
jgi:hypothetical protein